MLGKIGSLYRRAYSGLPRGAWILFAVNLVNSSGAMVIFFLSLYLTRKLGFTPARAGQALGLYGLGSVFGAFCGGWLADKMGSVTVQKASLFLSGTFLISLGFVRQLWLLLPLLFLFALSAGSLYPANATSMAAVCPHDLQVKGFALNRLAGNIGATIGPAVGGVLALHDYRLLFWADGATSLAAAAVFALLWKGAGRVVREGEGEGEGVGIAAGVGKERLETGQIGDGSTDEVHAANASAAGAGQRDAAASTRAIAIAPAPSLTPWRDAPFLALLVILFVWSAVFIQLLSTFPLYMRDVYGLAENHIGQLFAVNTVIIVFLEMILMERIRRRSLPRMISVSFILLGAGFGLMPLGRSFLYAAFTVVVWTFGEMLSIPLVTTMISARADDSTRGRYLGLNSFVFSLALIVAPAAGMAVYGRFGGTALWFGCTGVGVLLALLLTVLTPWLEKPRARRQ
jgi:predicted MFS family arabinose efflux permease